MTDTIEIRARMFIKADGSVRAVRNKDGVKSAYKTPEDSQKDGEQSIGVTINVPKSFFEDRLKITVEVPETKDKSSDIKMIYDSKSGEWA